MKMKLIEIKEYTGVIILESGLHIGAGSDEIKIGGIDSPVVKNPVTGRPYIPGSSLKGKIRTLLEWNEGNVDEKGLPFSTDKSENLIARIFGNGKIKEDYNGGPTRVSFNDCELLEESARELAEAGGFTEEKTEISMNRRTGTARNGGLRNIERVPAGARFDFCVTFKIFDMDDGGKVDRAAYELLKRGFKLLELDSLGGSGSRGYGRIRFDNTSDKSVWPESGNAPA